MDGKPRDASHRRGKQTNVIYLRFLVARVFFSSRVPSQGRHFHCMLYYSVQKRYSHFRVVHTSLLNFVQAPVSCLLSTLQVLQVQAAGFVVTELFASEALQPTRVLVRQSCKKLLCSPHGSVIPGKLQESPHLPDPLSLRPPIPSARC
jgi:hypothetical protein